MNEENMSHDDKERPRIVGLNTMDRHVLASAVADDEIEYPSDNRFSSKAMKLMKAYEALCDEIPKDKGEIRLLDDDELSVWSGAVAASTRDALALCPYIGIIKPCYSTDAGTSILIDDGYRAMVGPWFFDEACRQYRVTMLIHSVLHPLMGHCDSKLVQGVALAAGDCQINQGLIKNMSLQWPVDSTKPSSSSISAYGTFGRRMALFPSDVRTSKYPNGLPEHRNFNFYYNEIFNEFPPMLFDVEVDDDGNVTNVTIKQAEQRDTSSSDMDEALADMEDAIASNDNNGDGNSGDGTSQNGDDKAGQSNDGMPDVSDKADNFQYIKGFACKGFPNGSQSIAMDELGIKKAGLSEEVMAQTLSQQIAKQLAKKAGYGSGSEWVNFVIDAVTPPITPWSTIVGNFIAHNMDNLTTIGRDVKSPRRVDRREFTDDPSFIRRGYTDPRVTLVWIMDVSGSMMGDDMPRGMNELAGLLNNCANIDVKFLPIDTEVKGFQSVESIGSIKPTQGAGGTALGPAFAWIAEHMRPLPDAIVLTTDCELSDWGDVVKEMKYGMLKGTPMVIVGTDNRGVMNIPADLLRMEGVDAFCVDPKSPTRKINAWDTKNLRADDADF